MERQIPLDPERGSQMNAKATESSPPAVAILSSTMQPWHQIYGR